MRHRSVKHVAEKTSAAPAKLKRIREERAFVNKIGTPNARKTVTSTWARNHANLCTLTRLSAVGTLARMRVRTSIFLLSLLLLLKYQTTLFLSASLARCVTRRNSFFANKQIRLSPLYMLITLRRGAHSGKLPDSEIIRACNLARISSPNGGCFDDRLISARARSIIAYDGHVSARLRVPLKGRMLFGCQRCANAESGTSDETLRIVKSSGLWARAMMVVVTTRRRYLGVVELALGLGSAFIYKTSRRGREFKGQSGVGCRYVKPIFVPTTKRLQRGRFRGPLTAASKTGWRVYGAPPERGSFLLVAGLRAMHMKLRAERLCNYSV